MTREEADQLIRCVKECWWRVGVLLFLVCCFVLLAAHGWPQGDWTLGWGAIGAIATVVTGCAAVLIAYRQKKSNDEFRENLDWMERRSTNQLLNEINQELSYVLLETEKLLKPENLNSDAWLSVLKEVVDIRKRLPREDFRFDSRHLLNGDYMDALFDLKTAINALDRDPQNLNFEKIDLEEQKSEGRDLIIAAVWLQNELVPLADVVACVGEGFECSGFNGLKEAMVGRFGRALDGVQEVWLPTPKAEVVA